MKLKISDSYWHHRTKNYILWLIDEGPRKLDLGWYVEVLLGIDLQILLGKTRAELNLKIMLKSPNTGPGPVSINLLLLSNYNKLQICWKTSTLFSVYWLLKWKRIEICKKHEKTLWMALGDNWCILSSCGEKEE